MCIKRGGGGHNINVSLNLKQKFVVPMFFAQTSLQSRYCFVKTEELSKVSHIYLFLAYI